MGRRWWTLCVVMAFALTMSLALHAAPQDVRTLEKQLDDEVAALSTSDCNLACRALASIRRAADRICALEPGPRCDAARAKVAEATRRVKETCPECVVSFVPESESAPPAAKGDEAESTVQVSQAAPKRGGCRACMTAPGPNRTDFVWLVFAGWVVFGLRRRPKKDRRRL
jgi:hypothetical protein